MEDKVVSIYYYIDDRGCNPVKEFIHTLPENEQAKVYAYLRELKKEGNNLRRPMADYLGEGIYELRPKDNRIFYLFYLKSNAVLVHAIKKRTKKITRRDMQLCLKRKKQIEIEEKHIEKIEL